MSVRSIRLKATTAFVASGRSLPAGFYSGMRTALPSDKHESGELVQYRVEAMGGIVDVTELVEAGSLVEVLTN